MRDRRAVPERRGRDLAHLLSAVGLATALLLPLPVSAFQVDTLHLSLDDALRTAEGGNPGFRQADNAVGLNSIESRTTWLSELIPQVNVQLFSTDFTGNLQRRATDNFGNPIENPTADWNYFSRTTQSLNLSWTFQGRSLFDTHRRQSLVNRDRELARGAALSGLQIEVQRRYIGALEERELMRAEEALIEARTVDLEVVQRLFALALRTRVDVLNAELAVEQQALAHRRQQGAFDRALLALRTTLGAEGPGEVVLADEPLPIFDPSGLDADVLVRRALEANPGLRRADVAVSQASLGVSEQRNRWWPQVSMGFNLARRAQRPSDGALFDVSFDEDLDRSFFVQLSLPVFNGFFENRRAAEQAAVELDNQREADREARLEVEEVVRGARMELDNQWETLRLAERSLEIAEEALRLAREEYRLGARSFEDLRASFDQEAETRRQVIAARYGFVDALLDLEEAVGEPVRPAGASTPGLGG
ncbi:MAG: TolC family protein [Gemmatimonadota bacterium]